MPESPASFLKFLFKVRESGSLGPEHGPSVVHCSAGIGRSGTFALVDTCLILVGVVVVVVRERGCSQSFDIYTENKNFCCTRQEVERMMLFLVQQIQRERLWHVGVFYGLDKEFSPILPPENPTLEQDVGAGGANPTVSGGVLIPW